MKWNFIKIKNKYSKYDFRIKAKNNDYSKIDFRKHSIFRTLVSLSSYLTNGVIFKNKFYKINFNQKKPAIFDFSINNTKQTDSYLTLDDNINIITLHTKDYKINISNLPASEIFSSLFTFQIIKNFSKFIKDNIEAYNNLSKSNYYIVTGWIKSDKSDKNIILDLLTYKKEKVILNRCKILDENILDKFTTSFKGTYSLFLIKFKNSDFELYKTIPISFDEYLSYIYDLMLPYKYNFNDTIVNTNDYFNYNNDDIERIAFAIDPDGSKDRDDAISAFYYNNNNIVYNLEEATHIKLIVHISDTLPYIQPKNNNYYYHYCRYKGETNYLDHLNLPMMDRILSEEKLSLDGDKNNAITINLTYKIMDKDKFQILPTPEKVQVHKSKNLKIFGTTYKIFSESFDFKPEDGFSNKFFNRRNLISCNKDLERNFNPFIYQGSSLYPNKIKNLIANNLKQLYIFFVNSLNQTGKDTLINIPSSLVRHKMDGKSNIYLEFSPVDFWSHSLIEYTAIESNIYFSQLMYLVLNKNLKMKNNIYTFDYRDINLLTEKVGEKNQKLLLENVTMDKEIKLKKQGIYRNLFTPDEEVDYYINRKINSLINKMYQSASKKYEDDYFIFQETFNKFVKYFGYQNTGSPSNRILTYFKVLLALRQVLLLHNSKNNLDITLKLISKELKMKAKYDFFPFGHYDIASIFYTHATSPMRRFTDINVHHLIFNPKYEKYIYGNINLENINKKVAIGKSLHFLVNSSKFTEFIQLNKNIVTNVELIDKKFNSIGFIDLVNMFGFSENFGLPDKKCLVELSLDEYNIPFLKVVNSKTYKKKFNIFFHMLKKENSKVKNECQKFLEKLFKINKVNKIC